MFICHCGHVLIEQIDYHKKCVLYLVLSDGGVVSRSHNFFIVKCAIPALSPEGPETLALNPFIHSSAID